MGRQSMDPVHLSSIYQTTLLIAKIILGFGCSFCKTTHQELIYIISGSITFTGFLLLTIIPNNKMDLIQTALVILGIGSGTSGGSWITLLVNNIGKDNITAAISVYTPFINILMSVNLSIFGELQEAIKNLALLLPSCYVFIAV